MTGDTLILDSLNIPADIQQTAGGMDTLKLYYAETYISLDSVSRTVSMREAHPGIKGNPVPFRLSADNGVTALIFLCFFLTAYVFSNGKKFLLQQMKDFVYVRERGNLFNSSTADDVRYRLILFSQTAILLGICAFDYFHNLTQGRLHENYSFGILSANIAVCILYYLLKWLLYSFLGWTFFDKTRTTVWLEAYSTILYYLGFALFPLVLLIVYFDSFASLLLPAGLVVIIFAKILMFYKWIKLFFNNLYGLFCLIVYFCALEIMPCFILFRALAEVNNLLLIKL